MFASSNRANKLRHELQGMLIEPEQVDAASLSLCVFAMREGGPYRRLHNRRGRLYDSFEVFSEDRLPYGLGISESELERVVCDAISHQRETDGSPMQ
jgi:hypothetical protein